MVKPILAITLLASTGVAFADEPVVNEDGSIDVVDFAKPPPPDDVEPPAIVVDPDPPREPPICILPYYPPTRRDTRDDVTSLLGFHIGFGQLPIGSARLQTTALGLSVEHRLHGRWRVLGAYEYVWLGTRDSEPDKVLVMDGTAHRVQLGLRRTLVASKPKLGGTTRFYADVELGGGVLLGSEPMTGTIVQPLGFAGVRLGYTFMNMHPGSRASIAWEPEILIRGFAVDEGYGGLLAVGMTWGD